MELDLRKKEKVAVDYWSLNIWLLGKLEKVEIRRRVVTVAMEILGEPQHVDMAEARIKMIIVAGIVGVMNHPDQIAHARTQLEQGEQNQVAGSNQKSSTDVAASRPSSSCLRTVPSTTTGQGETSWHIFVGR